MAKNRKKVAKAKRQKVAKREARGVAKPKRQSRADTEKVLRRGKIRKPQQPDLAGVSDWADPELDKLHRSVKESRDTIAEAKGEEKGYMAAAHRRMKALEKFTSRRHGIEFVRSVSDEETFRAKAYKTQGATLPPADEETTADVEAMDAQADGESAEGAAEE